MPVVATVTLGSADPAQVSVPAQLTLTADGQPAGALAQRPGTGTLVTYDGTFRPAAGSQGRISLAAVVGEGAEAVASTPVAVVVDTAPPALSAVAVACEASPCPRDGVATVTATASDDHLASVTVALDLDVSRAVALSNGGSGNVYTAQLRLRDWPFPYFRRDVGAAVTAADAAGNAATVQAAAPVSVTRQRWSYAAGASVTSPAVLGDGGLVIGVAATADQLRALGPDGRERWRLTLEPAAGAGGKAVHAAPAVGTTAIWAGADDGRLYGARLDGAGILAACFGGAEATLYTPALRGPPEAAFAGSSSGQLVAANTGILCDRPSTVNRVTTAPVVIGGNVMVATSDLTQNASLVRFTEAASSPGVLSRDWSVAAGLAVAAPLAVAADGRVVAASSNGHLYAVDPSTSSGTAVDLGQLAGAADASVAVGAGGELLFGTNDGKLHRLVPGAGTSPWTDTWAGGAGLEQAVRGVTLVTRDASGVVLYATTGSATAGEVAAVAEVAGKPAVVWVTAGLGSAALQFPVVTGPPPGAPAEALPTLYVGSADGHLHAIVVDTPLDAASPWPKSHHDLRNTGNAASALP